MTIISYIEENVQKKKTLRIIWKKNIRKKFAVALFKTSSHFSKLLARIAIRGGLIRHLTEEVKVKYTAHKKVKKTIQGY